MAVLSLPCCSVFSSWGEQGLLSSCGAGASQCRGFSFWVARALGLEGFRSCSLQALELGLVVMANGLICSLACGIFPDQGSNPCPQHWQADSQPLDHQEVLEDGFLTPESSGKSPNIEFYAFRDGKLRDTRNLIFLRELVTLPHSYWSCNVYFQLMLILS